MKLRTAVLSLLTSSSLLACGGSPVDVSTAPETATEEQLLAANCLANLPAVQVSTTQATVLFASATENAGQPILGGAVLDLETTRAVPTADGDQLYSCPVNGRFKVSTGYVAARDVLFEGYAAVDGNDELSFPLRLTGSTLQNAARDFLPDARDRDYYEASANDTVVKLYRPLLRAYKLQLLDLNADGSLKSVLATSTPTNTPHVDELKLDATHRVIRVVSADGVYGAGLHNQYRIWAE